VCQDTFLVYNWKSGAGLGGNLEWTQNWQAETSTIWFNLTVSGVTGIGKQKVQLAIGLELISLLPIEEKPIGDGALSWFFYFQSKAMSVENDFCKTFKSNRKKYNASVPQLCIRYVLQRGALPFRNPLHTNTF
jgi:hypothetical protein